MSLWSFLGLASAADFQALQEELLAAREENETLRAQMEERITAVGQDCMKELRGMLQELIQKIDELQAGAELERSDTRLARREFLTAVDSAKIELSNKLLDSGEKQEISEKLVMQGLESNHSQGAEVQKQIDVLRELLETSGTGMTALRGLIQENASRQEASLLQMREIQSDLFVTQSQRLEALAQANAEQERCFLDNLNQLKKDVNEAKEVLLSEVRIANPRGVLKRLDEDQIRMRDTLLETQSAVNMLPEMKEYLSMLWEVTKLVWVNDLLDDLEREL